MSVSASGHGEPYVRRLAHVLDRSDLRPCLRHEGQSVTARELLAQVYRYARVLSGLGLGRGEIVALIAPICPEALAVRYAANLLGAGATFLSIPAKPQDRADLISTIEPRLLVVFPDTAGFVPAGVRASVASIGATRIAGPRLDDLARRVPAEPVECQAQPADLAVVVSSGGSTGVPKGSRRDFAAYTAMVTVPSPDDRRQLINGPLAYLSQVLVDITLLGGGTVVMRDRYDALDMLRTIASERITDVFLVEPQLFELMDHPELASTDLSSLRTVTHIGASAPPTLRLRARQKFGPRIVHTYGASEEGLVSILTAAEDDPADPERFHSAGRPLPHVEVRFRNEDGTLCEPGVSGSIEVRSPAMAQGYRNRPDLEAEAFRDGWYQSGDLGCLDKDGYLHIFGRSVDIEIVEGQMVSPILIEDALCRLPDVRYATVVIDPERKSRIAVAVPWPESQIDEKACCDAVRHAFGAPVAASLRIVARSSVPLTPQGKPDREAIRALAHPA